MVAAEVIDVEGGGQDSVVGAPANLIAVLVSGRDVEPADP
jgi:hypothetical protein